MTRAARALLGREMGRLAAGRVVLFGGLAALLLLGLMSAGVVAGLYALSDDAPHRAAMLRSYAMEATEGFDTVLLLLAAILGSNQVASDVRGGAIFGILARPVSRSRLFVTSWAASAAFLVALEAIRSVSFLAAAAWLEGRIDLLAVLGSIGVVAGHLLILAMFAALGAVVDAGWAALAGLAALIVSGLAYRKILGDASREIVDAVASFLPLFTRQSDLIRDALRGGTLEAGPIAEVIAYRLCWTALFLVLGAYGFGRRELTPRL